MVIYQEQREHLYSLNEKIEQTKKEIIYLGIFKSDVDKQIKRQNLIKKLKKLEVERKELIKNFKLN